MDPMVVIGTTTRNRRIDLQLMAPGVEDDTDPRATAAQPASVQASLRGSSYTVAQLNRERGDIGVLLDRALAQLAQPAASIVAQPTTERSAAGSKRLPHTTSPTGAHPPVVGGARPRPRPARPVRTRRAAGSRAARSTETCGIANPVTPSSATAARPSPGPMTSAVRSTPDECGPVVGNPRPALPTRRWCRQSKPAADGDWAGLADTPKRSVVDSGVFSLYARRPPSLRSAGLRLHRGTRPGRPCFAQKMIR